MSQHTRQFFVGRNPWADRVFVTITRNIVDRPGMVSIDHDPVETLDVFSVSGLVVDRGTSVISRAGQVRPTGVSAPATGWSTEDVALLDEFWQRWHLNDMHAGCRHQEDAGDDAPPCPVTGYHWGSAWLVEPPTDEAWVQYRRLISLPTGSIPKYVQD